VEKRTFVNVLMNIQVSFLASQPEIRVPEIFPGVKGRTARKADILTAIREPTV
jgi:hypothetical protein